MTWEIRHGDAVEQLRSMPDRSVQSCITSPPYFGLRDYGTGAWVGGDEACDHAPEDRGGRFATAVSAKQASNTGSGTMAAQDCRCGATRVDKQIGLEPTPDEFVAALVRVFREVRRVLRDDGTLWLNLGDSYAGGGGGNYGSGVSTSAHRTHPTAGLDKPKTPGLKSKDLVGIPWMMAFALRADGWVLRQEVIWHKPNPMPESVTDRCTKAHEQVFMFSKARWTGADEPLPMRDVDAAWLAALVDGEGSICFQDRTSDGASQRSYSVRLSICNTNRALLERVTEICGLAGVGAPSPRTRSTGESGRPVYAWQVTNAKAARVLAAIRPFLIAKGMQADLGLYVQALNRKHTGRGGHTVSVADQSAKAAAAAACSALNRGEPVDLAWFTPAKPGRWVPMPYAYDADAIREPHEHPNATRTRGACAPGSLQENLGKYWQTENGNHPDGRNKRSVWTIPSHPFAGAHFATFPPKLIEPMVLAGTPERGTILDPFCGSGTTGMVALRHNRSFIGIELNAEYALLARRRICDDAPLLNTATELVA